MSVIARLKKRWSDFLSGFSPIVEEPDLNAPPPDDVPVPTYFVLHPNGLYSAPNPQPVDPDEAKELRETVEVLKFYMSQVSILNAPTDSVYDPIRARLGRLQAPYAYINPETFFSRYGTWARVSKDGIGYLIGESGTRWIVDGLIPKDGLILSATAKPGLRK